MSYFRHIFIHVCRTTRSINKKHIIQMKWKYTHERERARAHSRYKHARKFVVYFLYASFPFSEIIYRVCECCTFHLLFTVEIIAVCVYLVFWLAHFMDGSISSPIFARHHHSHSLSMSVYTHKIAWRFDVDVCVCNTEITHFQCIRYACWLSYMPSN